MLAYILASVILLVGIYGVVAKKNLIKIVVGLLIVDYATNLILVLIGYRQDGIAPIFTSPREDPSRFVDPIPQALILTSIVIGLSIIALMIAIALRLYEKYGSFDVLDIRRLKG
jgi:multicomponent Na+:H+ antiporter subunit C